MVSFCSDLHGPGRGVVVESVKGLVGVSVKSLLAGVVPAECRGL